MGSGRFDSAAWSTYSTKKSYAKKSRAEIFTSRTMDPDLDPKGVRRESRDSDDNPESTPIIIAQDVTGSMGVISETMARKGVPTLLTELYEQRPVTDPHIMCMAVGDVETDRAPLQVTQFEADIRIATQLEKLYLEGNGGGNCYESYALAWWFAANRCDCDSFAKRGKKGYLFTIGDEEPTRRLTKEDIDRICGPGAEGDVDMDQLLTQLSKEWEIFHVMVEEGHYMRRNPNAVRTKWSEILGQRAIPLSDHTKLAEVIVAAIEVNEGRDVDTVAGRWDGTTSVVVRDAVKDLAVGSADGDVVSL